jgi:hypothetical protein
MKTILGKHFSALKLKTFHTLACKNKILHRYTNVQKQEKYWLTSKINFLLKKERLKLVFHT